MWKWFFGFITFVGLFALLLLSGVRSEAHAASVQGGTTCPPQAHTRLSGAKPMEQHHASQKQGPLCSRSTLRPGFIHPGAAQLPPHPPLTPANQALSPRSAVPNARPASYIVKPGDSLWSLATSLYGSGWQWQRIYQANKVVIGGNPRLIYPRQRLALP